MLNDTNLTLYSNVDLDTLIDVWFACKIPNLSKHHLHANQDIKKEDRTKIRTQQYMKLNTGAKEIQQINPVGLTTETKCNNYGHAPRENGCTFIKI